MASGIASGNKPTGVVDLDSSQTMENKTLDSSNIIDGSSVQAPSRLDVKKDTQANLETYASSASDGQLCFATDTKQMYQVVDNALVDVGSGAGGINYIENSDFEIDASDWTGDSNLTIARSTSNPLRGDASGLISKAAVDASGEVISIPFTIDSADLAKKVYISADVDASDANYADGDLRWKIVKDPNGTPVTIRPNAEDILGGNFARLAWFQSDATITEYELQIECNSANASAYSIKIDNVSVGPREVSYGSAMTDWKSYTPTTQGFGAVSSVDFFYRRVGDSIEVQGTLTAGTPTATEAQINLPNGLTIDSAAYTTVGISGEWVRDATAQGKGGVVLATSGDAFFNFSSVNVYSGNSVNALSVANGDGMVTASQRISIKAKVRIEGWSSNSLMSEDVGNREVVVEAHSNGGQSITAGTTNIPYSTIVTDTTSSFDGITFTVPETGYYDIDFGRRYTSAVAGDFRLYLNGSVYRFSEMAASNIIHQGSFTAVPLNKGEALTFRASSGGTLLNDPNYHRIRIAKRHQPQTLLETETVAARYTSSSGQSVTAGNTFTYENLVKDTHNAYSGGQYTVPVTGWYCINASAKRSTAGEMGLGIEVDSVLIEKGLDDDSSTSKNIKVNAIIYLTKDQVVTITNKGAGTRVLTTLTEDNTFSIARLK